MIGYQDGDITTVTLINPERHNALSHDDFDALSNILDHIESELPRVVIITGVGNSFCAGVEFASLQIGDWANDNPLNKLCNRVAALPMPVIAALNGHFIGGGAELAFCADFRIAIPNAKCKIPAAAIAVHYEPSGIQRVIDVVGKQMAKRLFLGLETFTGDELLATDCADALSDDPLQTALDRAENIAQLSPMALSGIKKTIANSADDEAARKRIIDSFASIDFKEAMSAVSEKRTPNFSGK